MKISHYICSFLFLFLLFTRPVTASHVVGGTLTYKHNGGSSYTITLKLFRDCGPNTVSFPNSVNISVLGNNGEGFLLSKDINMNLGTVTVIPSTLNPCAIAPDPVPCVQEGIYTKTVTNLPPVEGGYHLYWQIEARNVSITNVNTTCNCIGASFYAYIPGPWYEDFDMPDNTTSDNGTTSWSITNGSPAPSSAEVNSDEFEITGANSSSVTWNSQLISIASCSNVNLSVDLEESGDLESTDSILVYYRLNGGPLTLFPANGAIANDFGSAVASVAALNGTTVQIVIRVRYNSTSGSSEIYRFDDVRASCTTPNSNPTFNLFPPIFICAGQPFTFDHSATDINGDSLAYSFYTPYNGDNNSGSLDPTFVKNTAVFDPITWKPGYSATNPLGGTPLTLNPTTGLLTGTANTLGQYVVGVIVKEYRNGVLIGHTLRDFQFNVVNCPVPPPPTAGPDVTINVGCTAQISSGGFNPATVIWTSVAPGTTGAYNNYLSCTSGCANPTVSQLPGAPSYIDFQVCGLTTSCSPTNACDVVRVFFKPALSVSITPVNPIICPGQTSLTLSANGSGGTPPYSFLWNNLNPSQNIVVGTGTYTVQMSDVSGCPPVQTTVNVTSNPITANAGTDKTVCKQSPTTTINGTVTTASGGVWTGGNGVFSPNNTTLSGATYTPTTAELAAGFVNLTLTTTGNGNCSAVSDIVRINYVDFTGTVSVTSTPVSCFGGNDGTASVNISGGSPPYTYAWNTVPASTAVSVSNLSIGTYTVTTKNNLGCTITNTVTVTQPTPVALNAAITDVACPGGNNGSISITASGGTAPYTYLWQPGNQTTASITNKTVGTYTVTVKDSKLCSITSSYTINQPSSIVVNITATAVACFNGTNGTANSTVSGGTAPYTYTWSSGATSPNASGLAAGTYTLTVKDNKNCTASNTVTISQPPSFTVSITNTPETCNTLNNGTATATPAGGTPAYTYLWQPGALTTSSLTGKAAGTYTLTVTDAKGCTAVSNTTITEPQPLTINFISQSNVSCNGGNDGSVTANPTGGTPGYTYLWSPGGYTTAKISSLAVGSYTVTVTDSKGCTSGNAVTITEPPQLIATASSTNETCDYLNNGTANVTVSGGTSGYTYLWQPDLQTTATASALKAASYTVTVTDAKGCTANAFTTVTQPAPIVLNISSQTDVSCYGGTNGSATASPNGGTPGFSYLWSPGNNTTASANNLSAGKYSITVTDANGCTATNAVTMNEPTPILANVSVTGGTCSGGVNGNASASPTGGTPGYTYLWQPGAYTTANVANLSVGTYSLNLTDAKGCATTTIVQISEPLPITINFTSQKNVSCFGGNDGSVSASPSGGTANYTYAWIPGGATTNGISNLTAGTYSVTVTDANGCTATNSVTIAQPLLLTATASSTDETCDYLNNGTASVTASGGTAGYTYLWQPDLQTTGNPTGLKAATYTVTVTDTKGCTTTATTTVNQPPPLNISFASQNVNCFAGNDGSATANPTGGTAGYTYLWAPGGNTTATKNNLTAGTYSVTVTDTKGCTSTNQLNITQPITLAAGATKTNETCNYLNNGTATASANGGTPGYTYLWTPGGGTNITISSLASGTYSVTITDAEGCTSTASTFVGEPTPLTIGFTSQKNVSCFGGNDGSVSASPSGGTANYTYAWVPGGATTNWISNLTTGTYSVTVTDANGCTATNSVTITQPALLTATASSTDETCDYLNNGTASVTASGGTAGYTYLWQPDLQTTGNPTGLKAATYTVTVTDTKGCTTTATTTVNQPPPLNISFASQNVNCFAGNDGSTTANPTGGTAGYTYLWAPGGNTTASKNNLTAGTYSVTVTDTKGCTSTNQLNITQPITLAASATKTNETCNYLNNGTATASANGGTPGYTYLWTPGGGTTAAISNLASGSYSVTITDAEGCTAIASTIVGEPTPLTIGFTSQKNVSCFGGNDGFVSASPSGGTANYTYTWMPGGATTNGISNLAAGTYSVTVTDANGCTATNSVTITQPILLTATASGTDETCDYLNNGTASVTASGGTAGYTYLWQPDLQTSANLTGLKAATYTVTVTDTKGCTTTATTTVNQPPPINISFASQNVGCFAGNDGSATANPTGGTAGYTYLWAPGGNTTASKNNLTAGTYSVTVTDTKGCTSTNQLNITQPITLAASATKTNETCNYLNNGTATAQPAGGTPGYTYLWTPGGGTTVTISNLASGTYSVTITDAEGCTATASTVVGEPAPFTLSFNSQINVSCFGSNDGSVSVSPSGGTANYTYAWMPGGATTNGISNIVAGTYSVTATDANGCTANNSVTISEPSSPPSVAVSATAVSCFGISDGTASANATGGTGPYTYNWSPGSLNGASITNLAADSYTVTVTDALGCTATNTVVVNQPAEIVLTTTSVNSDCGQANGKTSVAVTSGGVGPFSYLWSPGGVTNDTAVGLLSGAYTVVVTDANGCQASQWGNVNENTAPSAIIFSVINVTCFGGSDGSASVVAAGGVTPYTYSWSPSGGTDSVANGLSAGTYTVTVTGSNGCQSVATTSPEVSQPPPIDINISKTAVSCFGGNDGTASAVASGGAPGYTYEWLPGNIPGANINGLSANTYTIEVTDANTCVKTEPVIISQSTVLSVNLSTTPVSCFGGNNGTVSASALGGTAPYSYSWMPGNISGPNAGQLIAGTYTVTITDEKGCSIIDSITVTQPTVITTNLTSLNSNCGLANGQASVVAAGGTPGYTYLWSPTGGTNTTAASLLAGIYSVTVTDNNGCVDKDTVTVNDNASPVAIVSAVTHLTCNASNDGTATVSVTGGAAPFTYLWSPGGATDATATGLTTGAYTVTVTDANSCQSVPAVSVQITQPNPQQISFTKTDVNCFGGNNGTVVATASGGTAGYTYLWTPGGNTTTTLNNLTTGTYTLQVTDVNNCVKTQAITISQPAASVTAILAATPASCFGGNNGTVSASASGGTSPYSYSWMPGNISGPTAGQLTTGTYTVTIADEKGCSIIDSITVTQPTVLTTNLSSVNSNCGLANGQASVVAAGGTPGYTYLWSPAGGTNTTAASLLAGAYSVTVTDNNGCVDINTITVNDNNSPVATVSAVTHLTCNASNDGTATVSVTGGVAPFTYLWSPGGATDATATGLTTGAYTVTVTDANSCQSIPAVSAQITQPNPQQISFVKTDVNCFGGNNGTVVGTASGGTAGYTYLWTPGGNTTTTLNNLTGGTYTLQVTDANNCLKTEPITISQPMASVTATLASTPASCFGGNDGTVSASASGGTSPYSYSWMPGNISGPTAGQLTAGTYTVTIADEKGCSIIDSITVIQPTVLTTNLSSINSNCGLPNGQASVVAAGGTPGYTYLWSPAGGTNTTAASLLAGAYSVTVTDNNGCVDIDTITVNDNNSPVATVSAVTHLTCNASNDGTATVSVTGGIAPFTYLWSPGGATGATATGLTTGTYTVTVTDANSCQSMPAVSAQITQPNPIFIDTLVTSVSCFGNSDGAISVNVTGGTPGYSYLWTPGGNTTAGISSLIAGNYNVQVTDINNCIATNTITVTQPSPALSLALSTTPTSCFNGDDGTAIATASGGTTPYSYNWLPGNISGPFVGQRFAGTYTVTVTDANGCSTLDSATIIQPSAITTTTSIVNSNCSLANGQASVIAVGGTPGYTYLWSPVGGTADTASSLMAGTYYIELTDNNGCIAKDTVTVNDNSSPTAVVSATTNVTCNGSNNGTATVTVTGGAAPYTYLWSPSAATTATATGLAPGTYTVVVTDANLCQSLPTVSIEITQPNPVYIDTTVTKISCFGNNDGMIVANAIGGTPSYSYLWMPGGNTTATINNLSQNTYTVQVTDGNSCIQTAIVTLTEPTLLASSISSTTHVSCNGENTGASTVSVTGGTPTYNYSWAPSGGNGPDGNGFIAGSYTVTVTDDNGCTTLSNVTINQPAQVLSATSTQTAVSCFGTTDGTIVIQATGGTPVYSYQWNPSVSSNDTATGLLPGNYVITVVDNNGCEANIAAVINEPAAIAGSLLPVNPSCSQANGSISTQLSGGTAPYAYLWQPTSATTASISGLGVGAYNLTVTDSSGCILALSATLTITPDPVATVTNLKNVSCYGGNDGEASVAISQGTPPFSISWLPYGGFDTTAVLLDTGSYVVTITDALGCQATDTAIIAEPVPVDVTAASLTDVLCNGGATGSVTLAVSGGIGPYSYLWAPSGSTFANATNLSIGTYSVTVSDQNNCSKAISMIINEPSVLTAIIDSMSQPVCPSTTGTASVLAAGGMPPYSYSWSAPAQAETNSTAYNLAAGSYTVTVTDSNGCAATANVVLTAPTPVVTLAGVTDTLCVGQSGTINASASGGSGTYTYAWQPSGAVTSGTLTINPTSSTIYTVVAYDQNGCPGNRDTIPVVVYDLTNANIDVFGNSPICPGVNTFIYTTSNGDTGPLTYQWNNGLGTEPGGFLVIPPQPTTYIVTVTNVCGTSINDSIQILFNPLPTIDLSLVPVTVCSPSLTLFDDNSVAGNPNDPIDSWLWDFGDGTQSTDEDPTHSYASPGNYLVTLTVSTGGGCLSSNTTSPFTITATPSPLAAFSMNSTHLDLPHEALMLNNQSTGANSYLWNFGDGSSSTVAEPTYTYSSIGVFNVQLIATNQFGCSDTTTAELTTDAEIIFPNAFTPNQDGSAGGTYDINDWSNDTFFPHTSGVVEYDLQIFNRWGELIFESTDVKQGWDGYYRGQVCQQDVYVWKAHVVLNNGRVFNKTGNVTLIQ